MSSRRAVLGLKILLWLGALAPATWLGVGVFRGWLGANPIETLTHWTGMSTLVLLLLTLSVTPVRRITGWNPVIRLRRPMGLFAYFYACLHFSIWFAFDMVFRWEWMVADVAERPYITVGMSAFLLLTPLALTSTQGWIRRLGRNWGRLHRLVYVAATLGVVHFYWLVKADTRLPLLLGGILVVLLGLRAPAARRLFARGRKPGPEPQGPADPPARAEEALSPR